jgi:predicted outer membrane protein
MVNRMNSGMSSARSAADMRFANDAATGGMLEVELGHVALRNAASDRVKEFAQRMTDMVRVHQSDVEGFQKETTEGTNGDLKNFAASTLPTIQEHLRMAQSIQNALTAKADRDQWRK